MTFSQQIAPVRQLISFLEANASVWINAETQNACILRFRQCLGPEDRMYRLVLKGLFMGSSNGHRRCELIKPFITISQNSILPAEICGDPVCAIFSASLTASHNNRKDNVTQYQDTCTVQDIATIGQK